MIPQNKNPHLVGVFGGTYFAEKICTSIFEESY